MSYLMHYITHRHEELDQDTLIEVSSDEINLYLDRLAKIDQYDEMTEVYDEMARQVDKKELKHLHKVGINTLAQVKENAECQKLLREGPGLEPCWKCKSINRKLGLEV